MMWKNCCLLAESLLPKKLFASGAASLTKTMPISAVSVVCDLGISGTSLKCF